MRLRQLLGQYLRDCGFTIVEKHPDTVLRLELPLVRYGEGEIAAPFPVAHVVVRGVLTADGFVNAELRTIQELRCGRELFPRGTVMWTGDFRVKNRRWLGQRDGVKTVAQRIARSLDMSPTAPT